MGAKLWSEEDAASSAPSTAGTDKENGDPVKSLFAWIALALSGDERYDVPLPYAVASCFGSPPPNSEPAGLVREALSQLSQRCRSGGAADKEEDVPCGPVLTREERERNSLGPLGAAQWEGHPDAVASPIPHSIMDVRNLKSVEEWEASLPRTCRQNLRRAGRIFAKRESEEDKDRGKGGGSGWMVKEIPISPSGEVEGRVTSPHSTLSHFRCVVEHELRLASGGRRHGEDDCAEDDVDDVDWTVAAVCEAVGRFVSTTRMAGTLREYRFRRRGKGCRDGWSEDLFAFLHTVRKGSVLRGQWFYARDEAAENYVWFHAVRELVHSAIETDGVDMVDLGPNGSDGRTDIRGQAAFKARYGFPTVDEWHHVADYEGQFW